MLLEPRVLFLKLCPYGLSTPSSPSSRLCDTRGPPGAVRDTGMCSLGQSLCRPGQNTRNRAAHSSALRFCRRLSRHVPQPGPRFRRQWPQRDTGPLCNRYARPNSEAVPASSAPRFPCQLACLLHALSLPPPQKTLLTSSGTK